MSSGRLESQAQAQATAQTEKEVDTSFVQLPGCSRAAFAQRIAFIKHRLRIQDLIREGNDALCTSVQRAAPPDDYI